MWFAQLFNYIFNNGFLVGVLADLTRLVFYFISILITALFAAQQKIGTFPAGDGSGCHMGNTLGSIYAGGNFATEFR